METLLAFVIGLLYAAGVYLLLRRSIVKLILGIMFLSHATNLLIFVAGGLHKGQPQFTADGVNAVVFNPTDPLPQALILTAIVIGFGITAFFLALIYRFYQATGTEDLDELKEGDSK
ncbi:MAG: Na+/H+ antiporter subunit C [Bacteroidetes bacterium HGW-Bacteroidetes-9]|jgi:multicomponent Na+:H+ antiporter subunit C|nr:MAG: Na+/H+ antiporter subunit C [Bacteroidetes bacterium HGW-Bacteroidetes-9]